MSSDAELLEQLGAALEVMPSAPSADEVAALRRLVREDRPATSTVVGLPARPVRQRVRRVALAAAVAATLVVGSGAVALATGGPLSGVARRAAFAIGLPVDSPELSDAKNALASLRAALAGRDDRRVADARQDVDRRLAVLSSGDVRDVDREARDLLRDADERLAAGHDERERQQPGPTPHDGDGPASNDRHSGGGGVSRSGGGSESTPSVGPSPPGSGSGDGGGSTTPTAPSGGSRTDGGSGTDGGSTSGH